MENNQNPNNPTPTPTQPLTSTQNQTPAQPAPIAPTANPSPTIGANPPTNLPPTNNPTNNPEPKKSFIHNPKLTKLFIVLAIFIVVLGLFFLFFRLPLNITTNAKSQLTLDNQNKGENTNFKIWIRPGQHTIRLESIGFEPKTQSINQSWFKIQNLNLVLKKAPDLSLIDAGIEALVVNQNNSSFLLYFSPDKNAFFKYNHSNKEKLQITPSIFKNLLKLKWNQSGNGVIVWLKYDPAVFANTLFEKSNLKKNDIATFYYDFHHYDITAQSTTLWGTDIYQIAWAQDTNRFYFIGGVGTNGYLGKAENNGAGKSRLLTNMPFTQADLAIDSQENNAYILGNNILYQVDLTDPARTLVPITQGNNTHFVLVDDENILLGSSQADPRYKSEDKYALFNLSTKQLQNKNYYTNFNWINSLAVDNLIILQNLNNLSSSQSSWLISNLTFPNEATKFEYEYLTDKTPNKITFDESRKILIVEIDKKLYSLPIITNP